MKKTTILMLAMFTGLSALSLSAAEYKQDGYICVNAGYFFPADEGYKSVYGTKGFNPEAKVGMRVAGPAFLWIAGGIFNGTGETYPVLKYKAEAKQMRFAGGLGIKTTGQRWYCGRLEAGVLYVSYSEKVEQMNAEVKGSGIGWRVDGALQVNVNRWLGIETAVSYASATDKTENGEIKLGGFRVGIGVVLSYGHEVKAPKIKTTP